MTSLHKILTISLLLLFIVSSGCDTPMNGCEYGPCDPLRKTVKVITDQKGEMAYIDSLDKWAVNLTQPGYDNLWTCILCGEIPDSLQVPGKVVVISGELKASCGKPTPVLGGQQIFYIHPAKFK